MADDTKENDTEEDDVEGDSLFDCAKALRNRERIKLVKATHPIFFSLNMVDFLVEGSSTEV